MDHIQNRPSLASMVDRGESNIILVVCDYDKIRYLLCNIFFDVGGFFIFLKHLLKHIRQHTYRLKIDYIQYINNGFNYLSMSKV